MAECTLRKFLEFSPGFSFFSFLMLRTLAGLKLGIFYKTRNLVGYFIILLFVLITRLLVGFGNYAFLGVLILSGAILTLFSRNNDLFEFYDESNGLDSDGFILTPMIAYRDLLELLRIRFLVVWFSRILCTYVTFVLKF